MKELNENFGVEIELRKYTKRKPMILVALGKMSRTARDALTKHS